MKRIITTVTIIMICIIARSQSYIPLEISVGTYWTTHNYNCCVNASAPACISDHYSEVLSDTIIGTYTYSKIRIGYVNNNSSSNCLGLNNFKIHLLRQDTLGRKIYEYLSLGVDTLIIDYSQQIGDTCNLYYLHHPNPFTVTSIDSVLINGVYHRRINYGSTQFSLIEGVGTSLGITDLFYDSENTSELICKGKNGAVQYPDTSLNTISCNPVINLEIKNSYSRNTKLYVYPNPSNTIIYMQIENKAIHTIKLLDRIGNVIYEENNSSSKAQIDITRFQKGLYFIQIEDENQNIYNDKIIVQ